MTTNPPEAPNEELPHAADEVLRAAELEAQALQSDPEILRTLGPPLSRRSPFMIGLLGAAGVVTTLAIARIAAALRLWLREVLLPRLDQG